MTEETRIEKRACGVANMPRKPAAVEETEELLIAWYKWEFLRRNPEYRKDYESFKKEFRLFLKHGEWYDRRTIYAGEALAFV